MENAPTKLRIERRWNMPNKWTFLIPAIKALLAEEIGNGMWADPFAGMNSPAQVTNDLNPDMPTEYHLDVITFLKGINSDSHWMGTGKRKRNCLYLESILSSNLSSRGRYNGG